MGFKESCRTKTLIRLPDEAEVCDASNSVETGIFSKALRISEIVKEGLEDDDNKERKACSGEEERSEHDCNDSTEKTDVMKQWYK